MDKERWQLDLAHQIGPDTTLHEVLIVVGSGSRGERIKAGGIFQPQELGTF